MLKKLGIATIATLCASNVAAQSIPQGFYIDGNVQYEYLSGDGFDEGFGAADITLGYQGNAPFGVELYIDAFTTEFLSQEYVTGVLFYDTSYGRFSIGVPKSAYSSFGGDMQTGRSEYFDLQVDFLTGSIVDFMMFYGGGHNDIYGAAFEGQSGAFSYGASYHSVEFPFSNELSNVFSAGVAYEFGGHYTASLAVESFNLAAANLSRTAGKGSIEADFGKFSAVATVAKPTIGFFGTDDLSYSLDATYDVYENIELFAGVLSLQNSEIYHLGAEYSFMQDAYVGASYIDQSNSSDAIYNVYVGYNFNFGK